MDITSVDSMNNQSSTANEIISALHKANYQSTKFEDLIVNYRKLLSKYLQSISAMQTKADSNSALTSIIEEGVKSSKEYKLLYQGCEEQRNKHSSQLTLNNKTLGDIIEMKNDLDKIEKQVTLLREKVKSTKLDLRNTEKKTIQYKTEIEKYQKAIKENEGLEKKIKELKEESKKHLLNNSILNQRLSSILNNLSDQMTQTEADKIIAENEQKKVELMFQQNKEKFQNITKSNSNAQEIGSFSSSSANIPIEIPKTLKAKIKAHQKGITSLCFDSFGGNLLSSSIDGTIKKWDCMSNKETDCYSKFNGAVSEAAFDHSDQYVFAGSIDKTARLWGLGSNEVHAFEGHTDFINCIECFPMSIRALTGSSDKTIKEWDFISSKNAKTFKCSYGCNALAILNDESVIISGHSDGNINFWTTKDKPEQEMELHEDKVLHLELLKSQHQFFSLSKDYTIKLVDIRKMKPVYTITDEVVPQYCESTISLSSDQRYLAIGSVKGTVYVLNARDGSLATQFDNKTNSTILAVQWRPNCSQLYVGDSSGTLSIWEKK